VVARGLLNAASVGDVWQNGQATNHGYRTSDR
jgi:hypothetical protein